jgi:GTPase SAR1 family protein
VSQFFSEFTPSGIALVKSWLKGKEIIVVGQGRAGKTTFINYFPYGLFEDERDTFKTVDVNPSARFNVRLEGTRRLRLVLKQRWTCLDRRVLPTMQI